MGPSPATPGWQTLAKRPNLCFSFLVSEMRCDCPPYWSELLSWNYGNGLWLTKGKEGPNRKLTIKKKLKTKQNRKLIGSSD